MTTLLDPIIQSQVLSVRQRAGFMFLNSISIIELSGKDAESFLQGRTSNDVKALLLSRGHLSSLLDRKGSLIAFMSVHRLAADLFWIVSDAGQSHIILEQFKTYHFREQIAYREIGSEFAVVTVQGPASELLVASITNKSIGAEEYSISEDHIFGMPAKICRRSSCGDSGFLIFFPKETLPELLPTFRVKASEYGTEEIREESLDTLRIEAGHPIFGKDMSTENLLPETGLEQYAASYSKGCFQGQEVLARIKTYGAPRRALVGLLFEETPTHQFELDTIFSIGSDESGCLKSNIYSPSLGRFIALAYIARDYRVPDRKVTIETSSGKFNVTVKFLPFYLASSSKAKARKLYDSALQEFAHGSEERAIVLLRETVELDPLLVDAYESLGVILSRHQQYDEAIALMHRLQSLEPDSIMAHTNLSVYYMQLGDKERAEEEKAIAMSLRMTQLARDHARQKQEAAEKEKQAEEAEKRLVMFRQVLEIDPDDFLANNGVGTVYVELGKFEEALPHLLKCVYVKPTHTVAYLALGQAYQELGRLNEAISIYHSGIDVAAKRGDLTPMKEMQVLLAVLEANAKKYPSA